MLFCDQVPCNIACSKFCISCALDNGLECIYHDRLQLPEMTVKPTRPRTKPAIARAMQLSSFGSLTIPAGMVKQFSANYCRASRVAMGHEKGRIRTWRKQMQERNLSRNAGISQAL